MKYFEKTALSMEEFKALFRAGKKAAVKSLEEDKKAAEAAKKAKKPHPGEVIGADVGNYLEDADRRLKYTGKLVSGAAAGGLGVGAVGGYIFGNNK